MVDAEGVRLGLEDVVEEDARIRVLVVDPDLRVVSALRALIGAEPDLVILAAVTRPEAVPAALPVRGVALIDVSPSENEGLLLVRRLSRAPGWRVVAMSIRNSSRSSAAEVGAFAFVVKGDDLDTLLDAIRRAASGD